MPKATGQRSVSARNNPVGSRSSRRISNSVAAAKAAATKKTNAQNPIKEEQVQELESDDQETPQDPEGHPSAAENASSNESIDSSANEENDENEDEEEEDEDDGENDEDENNNENEGNAEDEENTALQGPAPPGYTWQLVPITYHGETAGNVASRMFGKKLNVKSSLAKRLFDELAVRPASQRNRKTKLNVSRRSNAEALLCHLTGVRVQTACKNCSRSHGPWHECVIYDGQMCGSCTNCWYNASGSRCTFHDDNQACLFLPAAFPAMQMQMQMQSMRIPTMRMPAMLPGTNNVPGQQYLEYANGQPAAQEETPLERLQRIGVNAGN
ncbi:hypothetical protein NXS19_009207 [Fusarium pseudograminearum]|nr:hypothetical protein NXS19_009207 [Fusarium pseudograminearum]